MSAEGAPRHEIKLTFEGIQRAQVEAWVRVHPAHWRVTYPPRQVNNVYFDTADYRSLNDNLSGVGRRIKLRLRWYGPNLTRVTGGCLELKCKQGMVGWKEFFPVAGDLPLQATDWRRAVQQLRAAAGAGARPWLDQFFRPVLINHYQRAYYATPDQTVRLTVDWALGAYEQQSGGVPNLSRAASMADVVVVELKGPADDESSRRLSEILTHFPVHASRHSKYVHGMVGPRF